MNNLFVNITVLLIGFTQLLYSSDNEELHQNQQTPFQEDYQVIKEIPGNFVDFISAPARWELNDAIYASGIILAGYGILTQDDEIRDYVLKNQNNDLTKVSEIVEPFGLNEYMLPAVGTVYLSGLIIGDAKLRKSAIVSVSSFLTAGAITQILKYSTGRSRPFATSDNLQFSGPDFHDYEKRSFPSAHTTTVFAVASAISAVYGDQIWLGAILYSAAALTGLSRIYDNHHWSSDVFFGAVIGTVTGMFYGSDTSEDDNLTIMPIYKNMNEINLGYIAIGVRYTL